MKSFTKFLLSRSIYRGNSTTKSLRKNHASDRPLSREDYFNQRSISDRLLEDTGLE